MWSVIKPSRPAISDCLKRWRPLLDGCRLLGWADRLRLISRGLICLLLFRWLRRLLSVSSMTICLRAADQLRHERVVNWLFAAASSAATASASASAASAAAFRFLLRCSRISFGGSCLFARESAVALGSRCFNPQRASASARALVAASVSASASF